MPFKALISSSSAFKELDIKRSCSSAAWSCCTWLSNWLPGSSKPPEPSSASSPPGSREDNEASRASRRRLASAIKSGPGD